MLVTNLAGSIGGTTFRRNANSLIMQNRHRGASSNRLLLNKQLPRLKGVIQQWSLLPGSTRDAWNFEALNYPFVDKFGDQVFLSGRHFFIKQTNKCFNIGLPAPNPNALTSSVPTFNANVFHINIGVFADLHFDALNQDYNITIQVEQMKNEAINPSFSRREIIFFGKMDAGKVLDFSSAFFAKFPLVSNQQYFRCYYKTVNSSGFESITKQVTTFIP